MVVGRDSEWNGTGPVRPAETDVLLAGHVQTLVVGVEALQQQAADLTALGVDLLAVQEILGLARADLLLAKKGLEVAAE